MVIESVATSVIVSKIRKGKIKNIEKLEFKGWYFFILGFVTEVASNLLKAKEIQPIAHFLDNYFLYIHILSYLLIFTGIGMNYKKKSMWLIFTGTFMNFLVIVSNGGHMPVWLEGLKIAGLVPADAVQASLDLTHSLLKETTRLAFLADIIPLPRPYPLPKIISIGDVILATGVFAFIQEATVLKEE